MLSLGLTALGGSLHRLTGTKFVIYWTICFGLTGTAAFVAMIDLFCIKRQLRRAQQELIDQTLNEAKNDPKRKTFSDS
jgi:hypothetical protein